MSAAELTITLRYGDALLWAEQIHRDQRRKGKAVAYISHLISVSALLWEHGGSEDQATATRPSLSALAPVAHVMRDCTDTTGTPAYGEKQPWLLLKTRFIASLEHKAGLRC